MDYEKKYKEALERARIWQKHLYEVGDKDYADELNYIFPELKESEDERIRKALIQGFNECLDSPSYPKNAQKYWHGIAIEDIFAWLEKQGEQKSFDYENANIQQKDFASKPKFKVGDFIVNDYCMGKVIELTNDAYLLDTGQGIPFSCEHNAHLWTIQDAKGGDVLYSPCLGLLWIFKSRDTVYCGYNPNYNNGSFCGEGYFERPTDAIPATKEQRDILFKKMHEAGYMWDSESKQLLSLKAEPSGEQKPAWSEEDEEMLTEIITDVKFAQDEFAKEKNPQSQINQIIFEEEVNWLKSIKQRMENKL